MPHRSYRLRRLVTVLAAVLALGVATHGVCQAIEHHDGAKDAVALCAAAAVALIATMRLIGRGGDSRRRAPMVWVALAELIPAVSVSVASRSSAAWLQRFQN